MGELLVALDDDGGSVVGRGDLELDEAGTLVEPCCGTLDGAQWRELGAGYAHRGAGLYGEHALGGVDLRFADNLHCVLIFCHVNCLILK